MHLLAKIVLYLSKCTENQRLKKRSTAFGLHKVRGDPRITEEVLASQGQPCSMKLLTKGKTVLTHARKAYGGMEVEFY